MGEIRIIYVDGEEVTVHRDNYIQVQKVGDKVHLVFMDKKGVQQRPSIEMIAEIRLS